MGVKVNLDILPEGIDPDAWDHFYRLAGQWLAGHPDRLVSLRSERVGEASRLVYSRAIEHDPDDPDRRSLRVCGDLDSMQTAESFVLYGDLGRYRNRPPAGPGSDVLGLYLAGDTAVSVYCEKTQGFPYHGAVLGVAVLGEALFPGAALASGSITAAQCEQVVRAIQDRLGMRMPIPVLVDAERLYARLVGDEHSSAAIERYVDAYLGPREDAIRIAYRHAPRDRCLDWLAARAGRFDGQLRLGLTWLLRDWLDATGDLDGLIEAVAFRPDGPRLEPVNLANALVSAGVALEPGIVEGLDRLERPRSLPASIASLMGEAMLDAMGLCARHGRVRLGAGTVIERLQHHFPDQAESCRAAVDLGTVALGQALAELGRWAAQSQEQADEAVELGDGESFICRRAGDPLSALQQSLLGEFASALRQNWGFFRSQLREHIGEDTGKLRQALLRAASDRGLVLTELGWAWIDGEDDPELLTLLFILLAENRNALFLVNLRRGLFEHRDLCDRLRRLIADASG